MHSLLWYLTNFKGVHTAVITDGFYANTELLPQEYIYNRVGKIIKRLSQKIGGNERFESSKLKMFYVIQEIVR